MSRNVLTLVLLLTFLGGAGAGGQAAVRQNPGTDCAVVGAIRWDAWHGHLGKVGMAVEKSLGPEKWHYRVPFCGRIVSEKEVDIECASQETMDQEILYAAQGGIGYWAFLMYEETHPMSLGLNYYLSSRNKGLIAFSIMTTPKNWGNAGNAEADIERYIKLLKEPSYQRVLSGRPLVFVGFIQERHMKEYEGGRQRLRETINKFRSRAVKAGLGNPYIVAMDFDPERARLLADEFGFDAISTYATHRKAQGEPYSALVRHTENYWERSKGTGAQVIPIVMAGWDDRPRSANPAPWQMRRAESLGRVYYEPPTPGEVAAHVGDAIIWVRNNSSASRAGVVLIYAWNEYDEGGWLAPTLQEKDMRLRSLSEKIKLICPIK